MGRRSAEVIKPCPECGEDFVHITFSDHVHEYCPVCRKPPCSVCGKRVPVERGFKRTCSDECQKVVNARNNKQRLANKVARNPNHHKEANAKHKARVDDDPVRRAAYLEREKQHYQKRKDDPKYKAIIAKARAKYRASEHGQAHENQYRAIYREAIGEHEYLMQRRRADANKAKRLELLRETDPQAYADYLKKQREYARKWRQQNRLNELQREFQKLLKKADK